MANNSPKIRIQYQADGIVKEFFYNFMIFAAGDLKVYINDILQESGYTITNVGNKEGGSVIFDAAPENASIITLVRRLDITRTSEFQEGGELRAKVLNREFDYQVACLQQLCDTFERIPSRPIYSPNYDLTLPAPEAGKALLWESDNGTLINSEHNFNTIYSDSKEQADAAAASAVAASQKAAEACQSASSAAESSASSGNSASTAQSWAVGSLSERAEGSAKYWAENAKTHSQDMLKQNNLSNCLLEVPQDIRLELADGVLTLKAGSKIYVPNGKGSSREFLYDVVTTSADISRNNAVGMTGDVFFYYQNGVIQFATLNNTSSGTTPPSSGLFYNTGTNSVDYYNSGSITIAKYSLPLCVCSASAGTITGIKRVFNGIGYIGAEFFVLPGVKGLIPNGFNPDGTANNIEFTLDTILRNSVIGVNSSGWIVYEHGQQVNPPLNQYQHWWGGGRQNYYIQDFAPDGLASTQPALWYSPSDNLLRNTTNGGQTWSIMSWFIFAPYFTGNNSITDIGEIQAVALESVQESNRKIKTSLNNRITNCILEAPQGVCSANGADITVKAGLKVLIPDGFNPDKTFRNKEYILLNDQIYTLNYQTNKQYISLRSNGFMQISSFYYEQDTQPVGQYTLWYNTAQNLMYRSDENGVFSRDDSTLVGTFASGSGGTVTSITPYPVVGLVTKRELDRVSEDYVVDYYREPSRAMWYRVWKSGLIEQGGGHSAMAGDSYITITMLKPMATTGYHVSETSFRDINTMTYTGSNCCIKELTNTTFTLVNDSIANAGGNWYVIGY